MPPSKLPLGCRANAISGPGIFHTMTLADFGIAIVLMYLIGVPIVAFGIFASNWAFWKIRRQLAAHKVKQQAKKRALAVAAPQSRGAAATLREPEQSVT